MAYLVFFTSPVKHNEEAFAMPEICVKCGQELPESGACPCAEKTESATVDTEPRAQSESQPKNDAQSQVNVKIDEYMQKTTELLGGAFAFFKAFMRQPVTAMQQRSINMKETLFFIVLQPLSLFFMLLVVAGKIKDSISSAFGIFGGFAVGEFLDNGFGIFFKSFMFSVGCLAVLLLLSVIFGKLVFRGTLDFKKLLSMTVVAQIPLTAGYLLAMVFMFFSVQLALMALVFGVVASVVLGVFVFSAAFGLSFDKCVYAAIFTYVLQAGAALYSVFSSIV